MIYLLALISIILGSVAQLLLKVGSSSLTDAGGVRQTVENLITNPSFLGGVACYGLSLVLWLYVLANMELGKAYPLVSLGYVFAVLLGYLFLHESISPYRITGLILIIAGVIFIAKS